MIVVAKLLSLFVCYAAGICGGVFLHELGHALAALAVTRQKVLLEIGTTGKSWTMDLGRLRVVVWTRGIKYGATRYDRDLETRIRQTIVAMSGPLASSLAVALFAWLTTREAVGGWAWIAFFGLCIANFRILLTALWPIEFRPQGKDGEVWLSDSLDVWRMWRRERL